MTLNDVSIFDIVKHCSNDYNWINCDLFNQWMVSQGFSVAELPRHNRTDGEVNYLYRHTESGKELAFNGSHWDNSTFYPILKWIMLNNL